MNKSGGRRVTHRLHCRGRKCRAVGPQGGASGPELWAAGALEGGGGEACSRGARHSVCEV